MLKHPRFERMKDDKEIIFEYEKNERNMINKRRDSGISLLTLNSISSLSLNLLGNK